MILIVMELYRDCQKRRSFVLCLNSIKVKWRRVGKKDEVNVKKNGDSFEYSKSPFYV